MYWTDRYINRVMRAHKWHGENQTVMLFNLPQPMGLVTVHPTRQPAGMAKKKINITNMFFPHYAIYFVNCTSSSCSKKPTQLDPAILYVTVVNGVLNLESFSLFSPNLTVFIIARHLNFIFIRPQDKRPVHLPPPNYCVI